MQAYTDLKGQQFGNMGNEMVLNDKYHVAYVAQVSEKKWGVPLHVPLYYKPS